MRTPQAGAEKATSRQADGKSALERKSNVTGKTIGELRRIHAERIAVGSGINPAKRAEPVVTIEEVRRLASPDALAVRRRVQRVVSRPR